MRPETYILGHTDITSVLDFELAINAVERVMRAHGQRSVIEPNLLHADVPRGEYHIKTGGVLHGGDSGVFGLKANGGFFGNHERGLPNIVGIIYLSDAETGCPLAVLDSVEISRVRTGAATAVGGPMAPSVRKPLRQRGQPLRSCKPVLSSWRCSHGRGDGIA